MASYYEYYVAAQDTCNVIWIEYLDAITGKLLLTGCTAIHDYTDPFRRELLGVTCLDLNVVVPLELIKTCSEYQSFVDAIRRNSGKCSGFVIREEQINQLRQKAQLKEINDDMNECASQFHVSVPNPLYPRTSQCAN